MWHIVTWDQCPSAGIYPQLYFRSLSSVSSGVFPKPTLLTFNLNITYVSIFLRTPWYLDAPRVLLLCTANRQNADSAATVHSDPRWERSGGRSEFVASSVRGERLEPDRESLYPPPGNRYWSMSPQQQVNFSIPPSRLPSPILRHLSLLSDSDDWKHTKLSTWCSIDPWSVIAPRHWPMRSSINGRWTLRQRLTSPCH